MKKGMIKVSVLYPSVEGKKFDVEYYTTKHAKLVMDQLGDSLKGATIESGLTGGTPGSSAPFLMMANMYFDSMESYQQSFVPCADRIMGDLPNFTDIEPIIQVSEVLV